MTLSYKIVPTIEAVCYINSTTYGSCCNSYAIVAQESSDSIAIVIIGLADSLSLVQQLAGSYIGKSIIEN